MLIQLKLDKQLLSRSSSTPGWFIRKCNWTRIPILSIPMHHCGAQIVWRTVGLHHCHPLTLENELNLFPGKIKMPLDTMQWDEGLNLIYRYRFWKLLNFNSANSSMERNKGGTIFFIESCLIDLNSTQPVFTELVCRTSSIEKLMDQIHYILSSFQRAIILLQKKLTQNKVLLIICFNAEVKILNPRFGIFTLKCVH